MSDIAQQLETIEAGQLPTAADLRWEAVLSLYVHGTVPDVLLQDYFALKHVNELVSTIKRAQTKYETSRREAPASTYQPAA